MANFDEMIHKTRTVKSSLGLLAVMDIPIERELAIELAQDLEYVLAELEVLRAEFQSK